MATLKDLKSLRQGLPSSSAHINNLQIILSALSSYSPPHLSQAALISIHSFFLPTLLEIPSISSLSKKPGSATVDSIMEFLKQDKEGRFNSSVDHKFLQSIVSDLQKLLI
ncbi:hypothetical protein KSP39_PZI024288 [Platanthera zijinensis]|uniref:Uncharacterized protein n=1 Tax=Platanthera zijinensis TaxID=2320716 RepID=A0AAP0ATW5_9ASPA